MDTISMTILLLIAFVAWSQGITWLFVGALILFIIVARSIGIAFLAIAGISLLYFLQLGEYWFVILIMLVVVILLVKDRKGAAGGEFYSPELMKLLAGGQG